MWQPVGGGHQLLHRGPLVAADQVEDRGRLAGCARLFGRGRPEPSPGFCPFSSERGTDHFEQLPWETLVTTYSRGTPIHEWRNRAARSPRRPNGCARNARPAARAEGAARRLTAASTPARRSKPAPPWACHWSAGASGLRCWRRRPTPSKRRASATADGCVNDDRLPSYITHRMIRPYGGSCLGMSLIPDKTRRTPRPAFTCCAILFAVHLDADF